MSSHRIDNSSRLTGVTGSFSIDESLTVVKDVDIVGALTLNKGTAHEIKMPVTKGTVGQVPMLNSSGALEWGSGGGGGSSNQITDPNGTSVVAGTSDNVDVTCNDLIAAKFLPDSLQLYAQTAAPTLRFNQLDNNASVGLKAPTTGVTSYDLTLPATAGAANQVLTTDGSGATSWTTSAAGSGDITNGGNTTGAVMTIGTNDAYDLEFETAGVSRLNLSSTGDITLRGDSTVAHKFKFNQANNAAAVSIKAPTTGVTSYDLTLPATAGGINQVLTTNGAGVTSWTGVGDIKNGGNATGNAISIGTNDANDLVLETLSVPRLILGSAGDLTLRGDSIAARKFKFNQANNLAFVSVKAPTTGVTSYDLTLPATAGAANQVLTTDGSGVTSWTTVAAGSGDIKNGGNSTGAAMTIGTNDAYDLKFETAGTSRLNLSSAGDLTLLGDTVLARKFKFNQANNSEAVSVKVPASGVISYDLTLPPTAGDAGQVLTTDGSGSTSWATVVGDIKNGGNSTGGVTIGTSEAYDLHFKTFNLFRLSVGSDGDLTLRGDTVLAHKFKFNQANNMAAVSIKAPTSGVTSYDLTLPPTAGYANQVLTTNGTGATSWSAVPSSISTVSAAGTTAGTAPLTMAEYVRVTSGTGGIILSNTVYNKRVTVKNTSGSTISIYSLLSALVTTMATGTTETFIGSDTNVWTLF
jgi:hypothetical protein